MVKYTIYAVLSLVFLGLLISGFHLGRVYFKNKKEMAQYAGMPTMLTKQFGKTLVVYYSLSGNTRAIAEKIKVKTNADIYEIKTKAPIENNAALHFDVKKQIESGDYPALEGQFPDFEKYDIIFVGSPVWWYTVATPALSFLESADFKGKKVVPFSTQGSNPGTFEKDFNAKSKNAVVLKYMGFNNLSEKYDKEVDNKIAQWLNGLN